MNKKNIETRFDIGDKAYYLNSDNKCTEMEISRISVSWNKEGEQRVYYYDQSTGCHLDTELFASKEEMRKYIFDEILKSKRL